MVQSKNNLSIQKVTLIKSYYEADTVLYTASGCSILSSQSSCSCYSIWKEWEGRAPSQHSVLFLYLQPDTTCSGRRTGLSWKTGLIFYHLPTPVRMMEDTDPENSPKGLLSYLSKGTLLFCPFLFLISDHFYSREWPELVYNEDQMTVMDAAISTL